MKRGGGLALLLLMACATGSVRAATPLHVAGVGAALGSMRLLATAFHQRHPHTQVELLSSLGSRGAMEATADGVLDLAVSGREPTAAERRLGLRVQPYARTPIVFVTASGSDLHGLSRRQLRAYWRGARHRWPDGRRVRPVLQPLTSSESSALRRRDHGLGQALEHALMYSGMPLAMTAQRAARLMERLPGAFGYLALTQLQSEHRHLSTLRYDGVRPTLANLRAGRYPFAVTLYTVTRRHIASRVARFLAFIHSPAGARILHRTGNLVVGAGG